MTQNERVLRHIRTFGSITPLEAMECYGIMRLGARIWDLKRAGYNVKAEEVTGENRFGEKTRFCKYSIEEEAR